MTGLEPAPGPCDGHAMPNRSPLAGGFFLIVAIFAGFAVGVARGEATIGVLAGTAIGAALALLTWAIDRRRSR